MFRQKRILRRIVCTLMLAVGGLAAAPAFPATSSDVAAFQSVQLKVEFWWGHVCATSCPDGAQGSEYCCGDEE